MCILSVGPLYTLLKVVGYYDLSVLSMSVMGFQKKSLELGWVVGVEWRRFSHRHFSHRRFAIGVFPTGVLPSAFFPPQAAILPPVDCDYILSYSIHSLTLLFALLNMLSHCWVVLTPVGKTPMGKTPVGKTPRSLGSALSKFLFYFWNLFNFAKLLTPLITYITETADHFSLSFMYFMFGPLMCKGR